MVSKATIMNELVRIAITEDMNELEELKNFVTAHIKSYVEDNRDRLENMNDDEID